MKKIIIFLTMLSVFIILSTKTSLACSCADFDIDAFLEDDNRYLFYGTVYQKITNKKVIFEIKENYSKKPVKEYILIRTNTTMGTACGLSFNNYEGQEMLITGFFDQSDNMKVSSCSIRKIRDGNIGPITLNDEWHDHISLNDLKTHINQGNQSFGEIQSNSVKSLRLEAITIPYLPYLIGIGIMGGLTLITLKKKKKKNHHDQ
jgi:hypothetical protein